MAKFVSVEYKTFQSWFVYLRDLMSQKETWHKMVSEIPARNMSDGDYNHKIIEVCENFSEDTKLAVELVTSKNASNICFYLVNKQDGKDDGTHFLCGERFLAPGKFVYTGNKYASDVAGCLMSYLRTNGFLKYN